MADAKDVPIKCPVCRHDEFFPIDSFADVMLDGVRRRLAMVRCQECSYVLQFMPANADEVAMLYVRLKREGLRAKVEPDPGAYPPNNPS